jgi:hypothetical protein
MIVQQPWRPNGRYGCCVSTTQEEEVHWWRALREPASDHKARPVGPLRSPVLGHVCHYVLPHVPDSSIDTFYYLLRLANVLPLLIAKCDPRQINSYPLIFTDI